MGTSVSQRSPDTPPWQFAQNAYTDPDMPPEIAVRNIWRASDSNEREQLATMLSAPIIAELAQVAVRAASPSEAAREATRLIISRKAASLATELARRAVVSCAGKSDALSAYIPTLFSEATNYLVSRDINGYINPDGKLPTVGDAFEFKQKLARIASQNVRGIEAPTEISVTTWDQVVQRVVKRLKATR